MKINGDPQQTEKMIKSIVDMSHKPRILIVDDEPLNVRLLAAMFSRNQSIPFGTVFASKPKTIKERKSEFIKKTRDICANREYVMVKTPNSNLEAP